MKNIKLMVLAILMSGCSGDLYTIKEPVFENTNEGQKVNGVLYYGYKTVPTKVTLDRIRHPKTGGITHHSYNKPGDPDYCQPAIKTGTKVIADYSTQYAVQYKPGLFETNKFGVELDNGMLKSVNSESTPGVKTAVESLQGLVGVFQGVGLLSTPDTSGDAEAMGFVDPEKYIKCSTNE